MKEKNKSAKAWITVRVKPEEYSRVYAYFQKTTCRQLSEYVRRVLLQQPVAVTYRNQSADDLLKEFIQLKKDLNGIANNFNQMVKRLHQYSTDRQVHVWGKLNEPVKEMLLVRIEEIRLLMVQMAAQWSQK